MVGGKVVEINSLDELIRIARSHDRPDAAALVGSWFDRDPVRYALAVLASPLGTHAEHYAVYQHLTVDRRVRFFRDALALCGNEDLSGLTAGAFMLGRFIGTAHPVDFWNQLEDREVAALLDEWSLHARYLKVLGVVGERRISRARATIVERGLPQIEVSQGDALGFMSLKLSERALPEIAAQVEGAATRQLLDILQRPYAAFYDYSAPWSIGVLRRICNDAGIELPKPDAV